MSEKPIPVYGKGENIRDWLYVEDHCSAIDFIFHNGVAGETYNVGGNHEMSNIDMINTIIEIFAHQRQLNDNKKYIVNPEPMWIKKYKSLITYVEDRKGHDLRYAIDCSKLESMGWKQKVTFEEGIRKTINFYCDNFDSGWIKDIE